MLATKLHRPDIESEAGRTSLARLVTRLFEHWGLTLDVQAQLLGLSPSTRSTVNRYRKGTPLALNRDLIDRAGHLLGIHQALRILFPQNPELVYRWPVTPNRAFEGRSPVHLMLERGFEGVLMVRHYLDHQRGR